MSWAHPKHRYEASLILDSQEWNENLAAFSAELSGRLNENNWSVNALAGAQSEGLVEDGIVVRISHEDASGGPFDTPNERDLIPSATSWQEIRGTRKEYLVRGGKALVLQRVQVRGPDYSFSSNQPHSTRLQTGIQLVPLLNGSPRLEAMVGGGDLSNDRTQIDLGGLPFVAPEGWPFFGSAPAIRAKHTGVVLSCLLDLPPGKHVISLAARSLGPAPTSSSGTIGGYQQYQMSYSALLIDMWA
jgi:hypothetical protein